MKLLHTQLNSNSVKSKLRRLLGIPKYNSSSEMFVQLNILSHPVNYWGNMYSAL